MLLYQVDVSVMAAAMHHFFNLTHKMFSMKTAVFFYS